MVRDNSVAVRQSLTELTVLCEQLATDKTRLEQQVVQMSSQFHQKVTTHVKCTTSAGLGTSLQSVVPNVENSG